VILFSWSRIVSSVRPVFLIAFTAALGLLHAQGPAAGPDPRFLQQLLERHRPSITAPFEFAAIGDQQYGAEGERRWPALVDDINKSGVSFVIHAGDVKSGSTLCSDAMFAARVQSFNAFLMPMILTPGDNEWTDCHRENNGSYNSLERLAHLRRMFYPSNQSFGQRKITLSRQSEDSRFPDYVENSMWSQGNVLFASLHIVGSNNNLGRDAENDREYEARNRANFNWLKTVFSVARDADFAGVVLLFQANPGFPGSRVRVSQLESGFREIFFHMEDEFVVFNRPVLMVYGDSHEFHLDKPLIGTRSGRVIDTVMRLEVPGSADVHWVRVRVNPAKPSSLFSFEHEDIVAHRPAQQRP
jgi:Calcineurin-like phosphoesterase